MRNWLLLNLFLLTIVTFEPTWAESYRGVGAAPGYLSDVTAERHWREVEMVMIVTPPVAANGTSRPFVDSKLSKEFQNRYELKFGRTEAERNIVNSNRFTFYEYPGGKLETLQTHEERQREFGEYMLRRLTEHHVDLWAKSNPDVRPVYELKDRIANIDVKVRQGYKVRFKYSYSGNFLDVRLENPYDIAAKITFEMAGGFGPGAVERTIYSLAYPINPRTTVSAFHEYDTQSAQTIVGSRQLTRSLGTSLSASQGVLVDRDLPQSSPRHDVIILGFTWTE